jgi:hypothetical protein
VKDDRSLMDLSTSLCQCPDYYYQAKTFNFTVLTNGCLSTTSTVPSHVLPGSEVNPTSLPHPTNTFKLFNFRLASSSSLQQFSYHITHDTTTITDINRHHSNSLTPRYHDMKFAFTTTTAFATLLILTAAGDPDDGCFATCAAITGNTMAADVSTCSGLDGNVSHDSPGFQIGFGLPSLTQNYVLSESGS